jgi:ammonia channel protein AmtB
MSENDEDDWRSPLFERKLKLAVMLADLELKRKQSFWETPKALAALALATVAIAGLLAGWFGFHVGQDLSRQQPVITLPPGTTITVPK